jgi:hypothetical protein
MEYTNDICVDYRILHHPEGEGALCVGVSPGCVSFGQVWTSEQLIRRDRVWGPQNVGFNGTRNEATMPVQTCTLTADRQRSQRIRQLRSHMSYGSFPTAGAEAPAPISEALALAREEVKIAEAEARKAEADSKARVADAEARKAASEASKAASEASKADAEARKADALLDPDLLRLREKRLLAEAQAKSGNNRGERGACQIEYCQTVYSRLRT